MHQSVSSHRTVPFTAAEYRYKAYSLHNYKTIPQVQDALSESQLFEIDVVGQVFPFKTNSYTINELINWSDVPDDPIFRLTFPQRDMLKSHHFDRMAAAMVQGADKKVLEATANAIREDLNPHPAGQMEFNVPSLHGQKLTGIQHKYQETILFFPNQGQTCHAYCTFCFRWPQFVGIDEWKFHMKETELLIQYLERHPEVTDIIFTGGDPMIMGSKILGGYVDALLEADLPHLQNIRFGSKALSYWPYKFTSDKDADNILRIFERITASGKHAAFMAHFSHLVELQTPAVQEAIARIRATGVEIRTQSPVLRHINDDADMWAEMWKEQVRLGCIPYYMFVVRDTGAQHYFGMPLVRACKLFRDAYQQVSGIARTVRGPSMSCTPGKVQIIGVDEIKGERVMMFSMIQGKNPDWVNRPFFARYDENAIWLDDLRPAFGEEEFFFESELDEINRQRVAEMEKGRNGYAEFAPFESDF